jgi:predicted nucleic acid-binding protein
MPATWAYVDTSVLVKRYIQEPGSTHARAVLRRYRLLVSALAPVEMLSSLSRRRTEGDLAERHFHAIVSRMQHDRAYWELVEVNPLVLTKAEKLVAETTLRTLAAIHVASALLFQSSSRLRIPFITADRRQHEVAEQLAFDVVWVG